MSPDIAIWGGSGLAVAILLLVLNQVIKMRAEAGGLVTMAATNSARLDRHDDLFVENDKVIAKLWDEARRLNDEIDEKATLASKELEATRHLLRNEVTVLMGQYHEEQKDTSDDVEHRLRDLEKRKR